MFVLSLMFVSLQNEVNAQICTGSLGDPIINITFGAGANPGAALTAATTNYQYHPADCPSDGFYTLRTSTTACFGDTWHSITDHTGNVNGYFMLINASVQPSAFYLDTVRGLCGNTTYEFAAWVLNILKPSACGAVGIQPNLTFRMERTDGTILQQYNSNNIPGTATPQWRQFGFFFTTPPNATDVVLRIINNSQGGCGNDLALDDITFRPCGPQISTNIQGEATNNASVCEGVARSYTFNGNVSVGFNNPVVQWQESVNSGGWTDIPGATSVSYTRSFPANTQTGIYSFRMAAAEAGNMASAQCRVASQPMTVVVQANPVLTVGSNSPVCAGSTVQLTSNSTSAVWSGPGGFSATGANTLLSNATPAQSGRYIITSTTGSCTKTDSVNVMVNPSPDVRTIAGVTFCANDTVTIIVSGAPTYAWLPTTNIRQINDSTFLFSPPDTTQYVVTGTNAFGCRDSAMVDLFVTPIPTVNAGPDKVVVTGMGSPINASATGNNLRYLWWPSLYLNSDSVLRPLVTPAADMQYYFMAISDNGCVSAIDTLSVRVLPKLSVPNAFSPNGDGINDIWRMPALQSYPGSVVEVYDRYGRTIFRSKSFTAWDGLHNSKPVPVGTYYYIVTLPFGFPPMTGALTILR